LAALEQTGKVGLKLVDALGRTVMSKKWSDGNRKCVIKLNISELPEGLYYAQISVDGKTTEQKSFAIAR